MAPEFGSSLEQYLFEPITEIYGRIIAEDILNSIEKFEPRIEVQKINVITKPDENMYEINVSYRFLQIKKQSVINILALQGGEILI